MSYSDIKKEVPLLSFDQREELALILSSMATAEEVSDLISRRMSAMDAGRSISLDDFKARAAEMDAVR